MSESIGLDNINLTQGKFFNPANFSTKMPSVGGFDANGSLMGKVEAFQDPELTNDWKMLTGKNQGIDSTSGVSSTGELSSANLANSFSNVLSKSLNAVSDDENQANKAVETFASGGNIDVHTVMMASEKANLSMQLAMQVRGKLIQAYQEISRMGI